MLTTITQAEAAVQAALAGPLPQPPGGSWDDYEDWASAEGFRQWSACLSVYGLLATAELRAEWDARTKLDIEVYVSGAEQWPCGGCGSTCELHQPDCPEMDPGYLAWQQEQASQCHASITYGPREDPYGATCTKPHDHVHAVTPEGLPDLEERKHSGPDALGGGIAEWVSGGFLIEGDPVPVEGLHLIPEGSE